MGLEEARKEIQKLVECYQKDKDRFLTNEAQTCHNLIFPVIQNILHWDTSDPSEFQLQNLIAGKKADCVVYSQGIPQFIIEAKATGKEILNDAESYKQAIEYAYWKSKDFALLTNFKQIVIFCQGNPKEPFSAEIGRINILNPTDKEIELLLHFEKKNWLEKGTSELYKLFNRRGKRPPVDEQLLEDMKQWRVDLLNSLGTEWKSKFEDEEQLMEIEEEVQKFIDRLIFICFCEDKELNEPKLKQILYECKEKFEKTGLLLRKIQTLFEEYSIYDSDLFTKSKCDKFDFTGDKLAEVIEDLRDTKNRPAYNFEVIDADILGRAYENFIGHLTTSRKKKVKEKEDIGKRKKEGIYYTPKYIVDYIVKNTVGEYIKDKTFDEIKKVRVLDPACGSGSFLIRAFAELVSRSSALLKRKLSYSEKKELMLNCIYGVDLDNRAVNIARLNLVLQVAERNQPLPELEENIKRGNSLIDDDKIAGWQAFKWEEEFKAIMSKGGFDIVIGNPPYVFTRDVDFQASFKDYVQEHYFSGLESISKSHARQSGKVNLYAIFLIKAIKLLKNTSIFSFIIPNNILRTTTYDVVRKFILENCKIIRIVDLGAGIFEGVTASTIILILEKTKDENKRHENKVTIYNGINNIAEKKEIDQRDFLKNTSYTFNITLGKEERKIFDKIEKDSISLGEETKYIIEGIVGNIKKDVTESPINDKCKKFLVGKDIGRYKINYKNKYIIYDKKRLHRARPEEVFISNKIIIQRISGGSNPLACVLDKQQYYTFASTNLILLKDDSVFKLEYITGLLNSKVLNYYYVNKFTNKSTLTVNISRTYLERLPIKSISERQQQPIIKLVDKMLSLNKSLSEIRDKHADEKTKIEKEIQKTDAEINQLIYQLYNITQEEQKIIEESMS